MLVVGRLTSNTGGVSETEVDYILVTNHIDFQYNFSNGTFHNNLCLSFINGSVYFLCDAYNNTAYCFTCTFNCILVYNWVKKKQFVGIGLI